MSEESSSLEMVMEDEFEVRKVTGMKIAQAPAPAALQLQSQKAQSSRPQATSSASPQQSPGARRSVPPKFYERVQNFLETTERKREMRKEALTLREDAACTFAPQLVAKQTLGKHKTMKEMYEDAVSQAKELQQRREAAQEQSLQSLGPFRPCINSQSLKLAGGKRESKDLFAFLHKTKATDRPNRSQVPEKPSFKPTINRRSEVLFREKTVEELLMEDAQRRMERKSSAPVASPCSEKLISCRSERVLSEKFAEEFASAMGDVTDAAFLTKSQLYEVLRRLHFTQGVINPHVEDLWESLSSEERLSVKVLFSLLSAVLRLPTAETSSLPPQAVERIHQSFKSLYDARQTAVAKSSRNPTFKFQVSYPFRPDTSKSAYFLLPQNTDRTALRSQKVEDYLREKKLEVEEREGKQKGDMQVVDKKSLLGQYMKLAAGTVKRPQDRNEALFRLAEVEQTYRSSLCGSAPCTSR